MCMCLSVTYIYSSIVNYHSISNDVLTNQQTKTRMKSNIKSIKKLTNQGQSREIITDQTKRRSDINNSSVRLGFQAKRPVICTL